MSIPIREDEASAFDLGARAYGDGVIETTALPTNLTISLDAIFQEFERDFALVAHVLFNLARNARPFESKVYELMSETLMDTIKTAAEHRGDDGAAVTERLNQYTDDFEARVVAHAQVHDNFDEARAFAERSADQTTV
jgi:hypothetical protein